MMNYWRKLAIATLIAPVVIPFAIASITDIRVFLAFFVPVAWMALILFFIHMGDSE